MRDDMTNTRAITQNLKPRRRRLTSSFASLALGVGLVAAPFAAGTARADSSAFLSFQIRTDASAIEMTGGDPGQLGYPQASSRSAHSEADLYTGPSGRALSSTHWPGALFGNLGSVMQGAGGAPEETDYFNYSVRAEASSTGPTYDEERGSEARVQGELAEAIGVAPGGGESKPAQFSHGPSTSRSLSTIVADEAVSIGESETNGLNFGGVMTIESVETYAEARSDGTSGSNEGFVEVTGMMVAGQPVTVDENGVHANGGSNDNPANAVTQAIVDNALSNAGMEVYTTTPVSRDEGAQQSYKSGALIVIWHVGDPGGNGGCICVWTIGGSNAFAVASPAIEFTPPTFEPPATTLPFEPPAPPPTAPPVVLSDDFVPPETTPDTEVAFTPPPPAPPAQLEFVPIVERFDGIPFAMLLGALLGSFLIGRSLRRLHAELVGGPGAACSLLDGPQ